MWSHRAAVRFCVATIGSLLLAPVIAAPTAAVTAAPAGHIAFTRDGGIWSVRPDGSTAHRLTTGILPRYSPDGTRIAFVRDDRAPGACCPDQNVYVMNADGSGIAQVTTATNNQSDPVWSPDGSKLAFTGDDVGGGWDIYVLRSTAPYGSRTQLTHGEDAFVADWSVAGKLLYGCNNQICTINANGSGHRQLTTDGGNFANNFAGQFSPDGKRIAFSSDRAGDPFDFPPFDLWVMKADGSAQARLTNAQTCCLNGDQGPSWSPDGSRLVFASDRNGPGGSQFDLYRVASTGGAVTRLTHTPSASEEAPDWQP